MIASEIMTKNPECCLPTDSVMAAAQLMKSEDVGPIPIVKDKEEKKLAGIVTDRDLAIKVVAEARDPKTTPIEEVMSAGLVTCRENDDVQKAFDAMTQHQIRRIPIVVVPDGGSPTRVRRWRNATEHVAIPGPETQRRTQR